MRIIFSSGLFSLSLALCMTITTVRAANDTVQLYAAGSLRSALTDVGRAFKAATGTTVEAKFGPSGLLKDEIAGGAKAEVFAAANMEHPQALATAKRGGPVVLFARNELCALVSPTLAVTSETLLDAMLDPKVKLGTSTPRSDPSGDYTFEMFRKAEALKPGAQATLEKKALQLMGGASSVTPPPGRLVYSWHIEEGRADMFLAYCTATREAQRHSPDMKVVALPHALAVGADYGLTVIEGASSAAYRFAMFILSVEGQRILAGYGFGAPGLPQ
ncbi:molybdate ABC transporter periplasmic molybdate-binding protein [Rhodoplanes sp. Z2-YC6860]|nr:molybdate ABC transporter periplasmic molybdate-binding protein [Rhodoplanes sp. Z2-YC6860]